VRCPGKSFQTNETNDITEDDPFSFLPNFGDNNSGGNDIDKRSAKPIKPLLNEQSEKVSDRIFNRNDSQEITILSTGRCHSDTIAHGDAVGNCIESIQEGNNHSDSNRNLPMDNTCSVGRLSKEVSFTVDALYGNENDSDNVFSPRIRKNEVKKFFKILTKRWRKNGRRKPKASTERKKEFSCRKSIVEFSRISRDASGKNLFSENMENFDFSYSVMPQMSVANMNFDGIHLLDNGDNHSALDRRSAFGSLPKRSSVTSSLTKRGSNFTSSFAKCDSTSTKHSIFSTSTTSSLVSTSTKRSSFTHHLSKMKSISASLSGSIDKDEKNEKPSVLLAETRTPSFNIMLHANEFYSDNCTLIKRKTVRISWDDLANNTMESDSDSEEETIIKGAVRDMGGGGGGGY